MNATSAGHKPLNPQTALDLALYAAKSRLKTCVIQFQEDATEHYSRQMKFIVDDDYFPYLNIVPFFKAPAADEKSRALYAAHSAVEALELAKLAVACDKYDLVILGEVATAVSSGFIKSAEIQALKSSAHTTDKQLLVITDNSDISMFDDYVRTSRVVPN